MTVQFIQLHLILQLYLLQFGGLNIGLDREELYVCDQSFPESIICQIISLYRLFNNHICIFKFYLEVLIILPRGFQIFFVSKHEVFRALFYWFRYSHGLVSDPV